MEFSTHAISGNLYPTFHIVRTHENARSYIPTYSYLCFMHGREDLSCFWFHWGTEQHLPVRCLHQQPNERKIKIKKTHTHTLTYTHEKIRNKKKLFEWARTCNHIHQLLIHISCISCVFVNRVNANKFAHRTIHIGRAGTGYMLSIYRCDSSATLLCSIVRSQCVQACKTHFPFCRKLVFPSMARRASHFLTFTIFNHMMPQNRRLCVHRIYIHIGT